ncbi:DUF3147 family protein [Methylocaldum sp. BRCS4]|jgi:hypothetical protein|uniref:DUF3147 family protein n=1 Tax=Methylocaldum sp. 14B TaxID=1912213 RepID=UPI000989CD12|nr:DUF3147 family protein [Methylocaldum sp. 14B]MVF23063.1 DUF3147 family protein [Methylocaldum sp. BRCS4]
MAYYLLKVCLSALLIVIVSETAKSSSMLGAVLASLPVISIIAFIWLYLETHDLSKIAALSVDIFWLVIPSLTLFLLLPLFIRWGFGFWLSLGASMAGATVCYGVMVLGLRYFQTG